MVYGRICPKHRTYWNMVCAALVRHSVYYSRSVKAGTRIMDQSAIEKDHKICLRRMLQKEVKMILELRNIDKSFGENFFTT